MSFQPSSTSINTRVEVSEYLSLKISDLYATSPFTYTTIGQFGTWIGKWDMYTLMPTKERDGQEGFVFTELVSDDYVPEFEIGMSEKDFDKKLYPVINWSDDEMKKGHLYP